MLIVVGGAVEGGVAGDGAVGGGVAGNKAACGFLVVIVLLLVLEVMVVVLEVVVGALLDFRCPFFAILTIDF